MSTKLESRRLAAIVAADMVGYSRLVEVDEAGTIARQKMINDDLISPKVKEFGGRVVKTTGDGALIEFPSAVNAVLCSVAVQREMADREVDIPEDRRISYRVGINLGDIIHDGDDIFGDGVNVASRLEGLAEPGGIYISEAVFNNVKGKLDLGFADLGPQKVKNLSEPISTFKVLLDPGDIGKIVKSKTLLSSPVRNGLAALAVFLLIASGGYFVFDSVATRGRGEPRLLILPLKSEMSSNKTFADAATENLIASFARLKGLTISPRNVSMAYKGIEITREDLPEDLDIRYILDGTVHAEDGTIEIAARLRDTQIGSEEVIWEQTMSGPSAEIFDLLATLKQNATSAMKVKISPVEREILATSPMATIDAYLAYSMAENFRGSGNFFELKDALQAYEFAVENDPKFVDAYLGIAEVNFEIWSKSYNTIRFAPHAFEEAKRAVDQILKLNPSHPKAIGLQILFSIQKLNREKAVADAKGAVFFRPNEPWLRNILGQALLASGQSEEARTEFSTYEALSPRLNSAEKYDLIHQYLRLNDVEKALSLIADIPTEETYNIEYYSVAANAHARSGNLEVAKSYGALFLKDTVWGNLTWQKPYFDIYADQSVFEDWANAFSAAGVPDLPYDFGNGREDDRVRHEDLIELFSERYVEVHSVGPFGAPYSEVRSPDGTIAMTFQWMNGVDLTGTWSIKGDQFCHRILAVHLDREECNNVYIDREKSTNEVKHISNVYSFGVFNSQFRRVTE
jgi:class 3 adenylate cyclase/TolB-like protein